MESLDRSNKSLETFPKRVCWKTWLKKLIIKHNNIRQIPSNVEYLTNLESLDISHNQIERICDEFWALTKLEFLNLYINKLGQLSPNIGKLVNLRELNLGYNGLKEIPKEIGNLTNLCVLDLFSNNIKEIPKEIGNLVNLKELILSYNSIEEIPKEIGNLCNLKILNLGCNQLVKIIEEIGHLTNLEKLIIHGNPLKFISFSILAINNILIDSNFYGRKGCNPMINNRFKVVDDKYKYSTIYRSILNLMEYYDYDPKLIQKLCNLRPYLNSYDCEIFNVTRIDLIKAVLVEIEKIDEHLLDEFMTVLDNAVSKDYVDQVTDIINFLAGKSPKIVSHDHIKVAMKF